MIRLAYRGEVLGWVISAGFPSCRLSVGGEERRGRGGGGVGEVGRPPFEGNAIGRRGVRDGLQCPEKVDVDVDK